MKLIDLSGMKFGKLTVLRLSMKGAAITKWLCRCDCGNELSVHSSNLRYGKTKSCGCSTYETPHHYVHGYAGDRRISEYKIWCAMKRRCFNSLDKCFPGWGGRGITVCDRWKESFTNFLEDVGRRPEGMSLHRIDNEGNYEPGNARWASAEEQSKNRRPRAKRTVCLRGHPLTSENTYVSPRGSRACRMCKADLGRRRGRKALPAFVRDYEDHLFGMM